VEIVLHPHQREAIDKMHNGCVLCGDTGSGKTITALGYGLEMEPEKRIVVVTTAKVRDSLMWEKTAAKMMISPKDIEVTSWNKIHEYTESKGCFFIFDEQRLVGSGAWVRAFYKIAQKNRWVLLSATPGDSWADYGPVFIANGFFKNITEYRREHAVYSKWTKYPKIERWYNEGPLVKYRKRILVEMPVDRHTTQHTHYINCAFDKEKLDLVRKRRWNVFEDKPIMNAAELFGVMRKVVSSDPDRAHQMRKLMAENPRLIVFYNFNYELEMLRELCSELETMMADPSTTAITSMKSSTQSLTASSHEHPMGSLKQSTPSSNSENQRQSSRKSSSTEQSSKTTQSLVSRLSSMNLPDGYELLRSLGYELPPWELSLTELLEIVTRSTKTSNEEHSGSSRMTSNTSQEERTESWESKTSRTSPTPASPSDPTPEEMWRRYSTRSSSDARPLETTLTASATSSEPTATSTASSTRTTTPEAATTPDPWAGTIWAEDWEPSEDRSDPRSNVRYQSAKYNFEGLQRRSEWTTPSSSSETSTSSHLSQKDVDESFWSLVDFGSTKTSDDSTSLPSTQGSFGWAEWNGHKHEEIPDTDNWVYLVQYTSGSEGWNCITTDAMAFWSLTYSYKQLHQAKGRIDRLNTPYRDLNYYILTSDSPAEKPVLASLKQKKDFQPR
jgi:hypothetical protein